MKELEANLSLLEETIAGLSDLDSYILMHSNKLHSFFFLAQWQNQDSSSTQSASSLSASMAEYKIPSPLCNAFKAYNYENSPIKAKATKNPILCRQVDRVDKDKISFILSETNGLAFRDNIQVHVNAFNVADVILYPGTYGGKNGRSAGRREIRQLKYDFIEKISDCKNLSLRTQHSHT
ncbi:hypothetical protein M5K25_019829 [Dendrobium thyrsiflorum]|uniref:Uncharacterized protein n=1 Tax=Dendrobium thyrsiflorum TaxID=117978 RepID=A0ABD0UFZ1_DENTH